MEPDLQPDCTKCAALCCIALHFDRGPGFAHDKPAGIPCRHLATDDTCTVYDRLEAKGYRGCVDYTCFGAGQRVVQEIFDGKSWQQHPDILGAMSEAFRILRPIHEKLVMLNLCKDLPLSERQANELAGITSCVVSDDAPGALLKVLENARDWHAAADDFISGLAQSTAIAGALRQGLKNPQTRNS